VSLATVLYFYLATLVECGPSVATLIAYFSANRFDFEWVQTNLLNCIPLWRTYSENKARVCSEVGSVELLLKGLGQGNC